LVTDSSPLFVQNANVTTREKKLAEISQVFFGFQLPLAKPFAPRV